MRTSGLVLAVMATFGLCMVGCDKKDDKTNTNTNTNTGGGKKTEPTKTGDGKTGGGAFTYDMWEAWNSFKEGSWVEMETASKMGANEMPKSKMKSTITKKEADKVIGDRDMGAAQMKDQVLAQKSTGTGDKGTGGSTAKCSNCDKELKMDTSTSEEEIDVAGKKLKCTKVTSKAACGCMDSATWYNKDIPGWMAKSNSKMKTKQGDMESSSTVTGYEKK